MPAPDHAMWILRTAGGDEPEQTFRIMSGGVRTLGRATGADFSLDAPLVSRVHCRFVSLPGATLKSATSRFTTGRIHDCIRS